MGKLAGRCLGSCRTSAAYTSLRSGGKQDPTRLHLGKSFRHKSNFQHQRFWCTPPGDSGVFTNRVFKNIVWSITREQHYKNPVFLLVKGIGLGMTTDSKEEKESSCCNTEIEPGGGKVGEKASVLFAQPAWKHQNKATEICTSISNHSYLNRTDRKDLIFPTTGIQGRLSLRPVRYSWPNLEKRTEKGISPDLLVTFRMTTASKRFSTRQGLHVLCVCWHPQFSPNAGNFIACL